ncbi:hypothetical protein PISL3812_00337 [Talaromyces islandicus]|uniref:Uncharacterized protein n=1 Tax=Talaromyces islandicus TaxID=28573 RepID=A0A0U1LJ03_TALIS|nr:hypothetical protein PISL3812_00337 [Talaromyces islandicus]
MSLSTLRPKKNTRPTIVQTQNETLAHPLRRRVKNNPHYNGKLQLSKYPYRELARFHHQLQLRLMVLFAGRIYLEAFPIAIRPVLDDEDTQPDGMVTGTFRSSDEFFATLTAYIAAVQDRAVEGSLVIMKSVPRGALHEAHWAVTIATRYIESLERELLLYDDSSEGVEGHALARMRDILGQQLSNMGIAETEYEFVALGSCRTESVFSSPYLDEDIKSTRTCDRMFVPRLGTSPPPPPPSTDVNGNPWPTLVIETGSAFCNPASRWYMHYAVYWWFSQSQGTTNIVLLLYFDHAREETIVEKWAYDAQHLPFKKRLAQTLIVSLCIGVERARTQATEIAGDDIVLELDALLGREKGPGEADVVFDKEMLGVCTEGFLRERRNLGPARQGTLDQDKIHPPEENLAVSTLSPELAGLSSISSISSSFYNAVCALPAKSISTCLS